MSEFKQKIKRELNRSDKTVLVHFFTQVLYELTEKGEDGNIWLNDLLETIQKATEIERYNRLIEKHVSLIEIYGRQKTKGRHTRALYKEIQKIEQRIKSHHLYEESHA